MGRAPRHLVLGLLVLLAALATVIGLAGGASSAPERTSVVRGSVSALGVASIPAGWRVEHLDTGRYRVQGPVGDADLDVPVWDVAADVTIVPLGERTAEVRFARDGVALDTDFAFVALVRR